MATLNVRVNDELKQQANALFADLGLDMSTAVNMFLRQSVQRQGLPFAVERPTPNAETIEAMRECEEIIKHPEKYPRYNSADELFNAILRDGE